MIKRLVLAVAILFIGMLGGGIGLGTLAFLFPASKPVLNLLALLDAAGIFLCWVHLIP